MTEMRPDVPAPASPGTDRRSFLQASAIGAGVVLAGPAVVLTAAGAWAAAPPFVHGLASGDPTPDGILLWTRVTPTPESLPGSGAGPVVGVAWQVARDAGFTAVVASGTFSTGPARDHTVKVDVSGLAPDTRYWYRFSLDGKLSPTGATRTAPSAGADNQRLRLGLVSCSNWQAGYFGAYRHLAARDDLDLIVHVGDYIYEYGVGEFGAAGKTVRPHDPTTEALVLADYRRRHAQYKTDPDLQSLHARLPWAITWDDHETANDAWSGGAENHTPATEGSWAARAAAARQAYLEWMPVRTGPGGTIYRRLRFGRLAELSLLDLRSYRSKQVMSTDGGGLSDPNRTITGKAQFDWLSEGLTSSSCRWKLVGNPVMISPIALDLVPDDLAAPVAKLLEIDVDGIPVNADSWDGYSADRRKLLRLLATKKVRNTVFLTGDIHSSWANDVPLDQATYPLTASVATEIVTTSVTSDNIDDILKVPPRSVSPVAEAAIRALNRHVNYTELDSHGYCVVEVTPGRLQADWYYLADRTSPTSTVRRAVSFATTDGSQRLHRVARGI